jgi:hypothetical protein
MTKTGSTQFYRQAGQAGCGLDRHREHGRQHGVDVGALHHQHAITTE